jgi:signal transduction histidine kinase
MDNYGTLHNGPFATQTPNSPRPGGKVTLRSTNPDSFWFRLEIIDSGIGIAPEALPRIFDALEKTAMPGTGGWAF